MNPVANPADLESDSKPDLDLETPFVTADDPQLDLGGDLDQERDLRRNGDASPCVESGPDEDVAAGAEVDEILGQLHEGLQKAEATMASILEGIVADNATVLADLEAALTDMEAALAGE